MTAYGNVLLHITAIAYADVVNPVKKWFTINGIRQPIINTQEISSTFVFFEEVDDTTDDLLTAGSPASRTDQKVRLERSGGHGHLCRAEDWVAVADWCEDEETWLKTCLTLPNDTPSHDTFGNIFRVPDLAVVESCFREWIGGRGGFVRDIIALDGKTARGSKDGTNSPLHLVSAYVTSLKLSLAQDGSVGKVNELKAIRALLDVPVLDGCIVTLDALGCQTDVSAAIVDWGGDYVLSVKDNQKGLAETVDDFFVTGDKLC